MIDNHVFGWYEYTRGSTVEQFIVDIGRRMWNPTRTKIIVSQWVREDDSPTAIVIENVLGRVYLGEVDESTTFGDRAAGDIILGDRVGGDKAGGDITKIDAGGSVIGSANKGRTDLAILAITTGNELGRALDELANKAELKNASEDLVIALRWAATMATENEEAPNVRDQMKHQRTLDRSTGWIRTSLNAIIEGVSGALATNWLVELLRG